MIASESSNCSIEEKHKVKFLGTGSALPKKVVSNDDLAQVMDTSYCGGRDNDFHGGRGGREGACRCKNIRM